MVKRQVFFSFHYSRDAWRASQVRNMGKVADSSTFSDNDWEEVRYKTDTKIKEWIDNQLALRSCLVVLVGAKTSERKWVKYEIEKTNSTAVESMVLIPDLINPPISATPKPAATAAINGRKINAIGGAV